MIGWFQSCHGDRIRSTSTACIAGLIRLPSIVVTSKINQSKSDGISTDYEGEEDSNSDVREQKISRDCIEIGKPITNQYVL